MITIVDYGMGNLTSIKNMIKKIGGKAEISSDPKMIAAATALILPGVGHFGKAMEEINSRDLLKVLNEKVVEQKTPVLGICLGMQLLLEHSEEGDSKGLGWIKGEVKKFNFDSSVLKIPHMGWTQVECIKNDKLFNNFYNDVRFYFVHSYYVECENKADVAGVSEYGVRFDSALTHDNIYGVQFHPEKSHKYGMQLLKNYLEIVGG